MSSKLGVKQVFIDLTGIDDFDETLPVRTYFYDKFPWIYF